MKRQCDICSRELPEHGRSPYCTACRHSRYYWRNKTPAARLHYRHQLTVRSERMEIFFSETGAQVVDARDRFAQRRAESNSTGSTERRRRHAS